MEEFQLLSLEDDDEDVVKPSAALVVSAAGSRSGLWKKSSSNDKILHQIVDGRPRRSSVDSNADDDTEVDGGPRRGSLESLHFNFENGRSVTRRTMFNQSRWRNATQLCALAFIFCSIGFVLGYLVPRKASGLEDLLRRSGWTRKDENSWRQAIRATPDFSRCTKDYEKPVLVVQSFDGLAARFLDQVPSLRRLKEEALHTPFMRPVYPSSTFPNHYSIVTGLYPESHGIIDNTFSDYSNTTFVHYTQVRLDNKWWKGTPIWQLAQEQGLRVFTHYWPGSDVDINGVRPSRWTNFSMTEPIESRVERIIEFLLLPQHERPHMILSYFHQPDDVGHKYQMDSPGFQHGLNETDRFTDLLMTSLSANGLLDCVNLILLSDHGMEACKNMMDPLSSAIPELADSGTRYVFEGSGTVNRIRLSEAMNIDDVVNSLACPSATSGYQVYKKEDLPRRLHYFNSRSIAPVILLANVSVALRRHVPNLSCKTWFNMHGWDNMYNKMQAVFVAFGPSFRKKRTVEPFVNIELFNLFADLLGIKASDNNGTTGSLRYLLRKDVRNKLEFVRETTLDPVLENGLAEGPIQPLCDEKCPVWVRDGRQIMTEGDTADTTELLLKASGMPGTSQDPLVLLFNRRYAVGYCTKRRAPLWTAYRLADEPFSKLEGNLARVRIGADVPCYYRDPRLATSLINSPPFCALEFPLDDDVVPALMYPFGIMNGSTVSRESYFSSNVVPMYSSFGKGMWRRFWELVGSWNNPVRRIRVVSGPVYDEEYPLGLVDSLHNNFPRPPTNGTPKLASHFFVILTRKAETVTCEAVSCSLDVLAFIIPHKPQNKAPCQMDRFYFMTHSATVGDVELITGLSFFRHLPPAEAARLATRIPEYLWDESVSL